MQFTFDIHTLIVSDYSTLPHFVGGADMQNKPISEHIRSLPRGANTITTTTKGLRPTNLHNKRVSSDDDDGKAKRVR